MLRTWKSRITLAALIAIPIATRGVLGHVWQHITISEATTKFTGPLHNDGAVNYIAVMNEHYSAGVTPDNNAAILIPQIFPDDPVTAARIAQIVETLHLSQTAMPRYEMYDKFRQRQIGHKIETAITDSWRDDLTAAAKAPWKSADHPELAAWLTAISIPLQQVSLAAQRPRYFVPIIPKNDETTLFQAVTPFVGMHREIAKSIAARGMMRVAAGDTHAAVEDCLTTIRLGYLLGQQPTTMERLAAFSIINSGLDLAAAVLAVPNLSAEDATFLDKNLAALGPPPSMIEVVNLEERCEALDEITRVARFGPDQGDPDDGTPPPPPTAPGAFTFGILPVHFDPVLRDTNRWADELVAAASNKRFANREAALVAFNVKTREYIATLTSSTSQTALKKLSMVFVADDYRGRFRLADNTRQSLDFIHDGINARAYFTNHPRTPAALREWALTLPRDVFAELPPTVTFAGNTLTLYCRGPDPIPTRGMPELGIKPSLPARHDFRLDLQLPEILPLATPLTSQPDGHTAPPPPATPP